MNPEVKELLFKRLAPYADIIGTNEEELVAQNEKYGVHTDIENIGSVLEGIEALIERYKATGSSFTQRIIPCITARSLRASILKRGLPSET